MDHSYHSLQQLFAQLGLPNDDASIELFISRHKIPAEQPLAQASCWQPAQAAFLREALQQDADWIDAIDHLNQRMR